MMFQAWTRWRAEAQSIDSARAQLRVHGRRRALVGGERDVCGTDRQAQTPQAARGHPFGKQNGRTLAGWPHVVVVVIIIIIIVVVVFGRGGWRVRPRSSGRMLTAAQECTPEQRESLHLDTECSQ